MERYIHKQINRRSFFKIGVAISLIALAGCDSANMHLKIPSGANVTALGDSLTFGYGASQNNDYPTLLAQKTGWNVNNMGVNGNTSYDVLQRLDFVIEQNPTLVLLGIGGNDVLRRVPKKQTEDNITKIVQQLQDKGIVVVLIAQPHLSPSIAFGKASDNPVYKKVAKKTDVLLFSGAWSKILSDESLRSDQIHANDAGYAKFSQMLYAFLQDSGLA